MHRYQETRMLPYPPAALYALVIDVARYPDFLPWCRAARILSQEESGFLAELVVSFSHLTERYTSRVVGTPPGEASEGTIAVTLVRGPFRSLSNHWRFVPHGEGTEIHLDLAFEMKSRLLESLMGGLFARAAEKMVAAFTTRAAALYGPLAE